MDGMEQKLNSILSNPQMMSQIMSLAQSLGQQPNEQPKSEPQQPKSASQPPAPTAPALPGGMDLSMLQKIAGIAQQSGIDRNQQALLRALGPYLSRDRIQRLEKAMRAAKIAAIASAALGSSGSLFQFGR